jgi:capsular polysaccharide biosynthesis protein
MNDYYYYWWVLRRALPKAVLLSAALALLVYVVSIRIGPSYQVHYSYIVSLSEREPTSDFRYDGYYALSATDLFAATLTSWIKTVETVVRAYEIAGIEMEGSDVRELVKVVSAEKTGPQIVEVKIKHKRKEVAEKLAVGLQAAMSENVESYHREGIPAVRFRVVTTEMWTGERTVATGVVSMGTFVFALLLGMNGVLLVASFKRAGL